MKAENETTDHTRTIRLTEIPIPPEELKGHCPLLTEMEINVNYRRNENDPVGAGVYGVTIDKFVIPNIIKAINSVPQWQSIETVPKDGTWIILLTSAGVQCGYWGPTYFDYDPSWIQYSWIQYSHRSNFELVEGIPTHWQPLPSAPNHNE